MISNGSTSLAKSASDRVSRSTLVDDDHVDLSRASASTAPPRPANQMRRAWLTIWPNRPMRIMIGSVTEAEIAALESWAADVGLKGALLR